MKKVVFLQFLFLIAINNFAQSSGDTLCPFEIVTISNQMKHIDATLNFDVVNVPQYRPGAFRNIYFIHGLGGDRTAWEKVADACTNYPLSMSGAISGFPARKCFTHLLDYSHVTKNRIDYPAKDIGRQIEEITNNNVDIDPATAILIAHSQGGVVCRELMHQDFVERQNYAFGKYGGVVTVASPLQGAMVLNNRPLIHLMANDACFALSTDILTVSIVGSIALPLILPILSVNGITTLNPDVICSVVTGPVLKSFASNFYDQITDAYVVNGTNSRINLYNRDANYTDYRNLPKVAFYAIEPQENILWRTARWMVYKPNNEFYFNANDDWKFYNEVIYPIYIVYSIVPTINDLLYDIAAKTFKWTWWCCPGTASTALATMFATASAKPLLSRGKNWFDSANAQWQTIIGARTYNYSSRMWEAKENDGVVLAESAKNLPCATDQPVRVFPQGQGWAGSSHMQVRNDKGIKDALNNLFNGQYGYFFQTATK